MAADMAPRIVSAAPVVRTDRVLSGVDVCAGVRGRRPLIRWGRCRERNRATAGSAFTGGGTAGYNWQIGRNWVVGVEGDLGSLRLGHSARTYNDNLVYDSKTSWIATLRGRLGWSNGPTLSYVTGGAAWVKIEDRMVFSGSALVTSLKDQRRLCDRYGQRDDARW